MYSLNPYQEMFTDDVVEKKKTASGVRYRTGKRGVVGSLTFPSDVMGRSEKYRYRKAGEVVSWNIFERILPLDEFLKQKGENWQRKLLKEWQKRYSEQEIQTQMGISENAWEVIKSKFKCIKVVA